MLRVYRAWMVTPYKDNLLKAEKDRMTLIGEWEELVIKIDRYEYEHAKEEDSNE